MLSVNFSRPSLKVIATTTGLFLLLLEADVGAQVTSDNTTNTQVQTSKNVAEITGGIQSGSNLFHSFQQFSLTTDDIANFNHALEIENIFSRVTGGTISEIDGLIQTQGNTNLFLLNPAGIIFGANAQLDVGGSFIATTSDRLIFEDQVEFSAVDTETKPLLTISSPVGLQYGSNAGDIKVLPNSNRVTNDSGLDIRPGNTLALLGGDVSISRSSLNAIGSNVEIGSVNLGEIGLQADDRGWQFDYAAAKDLGQITFSDKALINTSGRVQLQGRIINLFTGSGILDFNSLPQNQSTISLEATESININGGLLLTQVGQQRANIDLAIADVGGDILIQAPQVFLSNGAVVSAGTLSAGAGGSITINAPELLKLSTEAESNPSIISTSTRGIGQGGQIELNTGELLLKDGSQIQALAGEGAGGAITVNATEAVKISGTGILQVQDFEGNLSETELNSGFFASSGIEGFPIGEQPQGESGNLVINTPNLTIEDQAQISVNNYGLADAGDIEITTSTLTLDTAGEIVANTASGEGGLISLFAEELVILNHESSISTMAEQSGNGGNITLETDNLVLLEASKISADASQGNGGKIIIDTQGLFVDAASSITASSEVEQKKGIVEIFTSDLNSRLATDYREHSSLIGEKQIIAGCGVGVNPTQNQLRDLGRGGIPINPLQETADLETISDLDLAEAQTSNSVIPEPKSPAHETVSDYTAIAEANNWRINSQGVLELVAEPQIATAKQLSTCGVY